MYLVYTRSAGCVGPNKVITIVRRLRKIDKTTEITAPSGRITLNISGSTTRTLMRDSMNKASSAPLLDRSGDMQ